MRLLPLMSKLARAASLGWRNRSATDSCTPCLRASPTSFIAAIESPPRRKKLSSSPMLSGAMPSTRAHSWCIVRSASVDGARLAPSLAVRSSASCCAENEAPISRSRFLSVLPDTVIGSCATAKYTAGTM